MTPGAHSQASGPATDAPASENALWGLDILLAITIVAMLNALALGTHRAAAFKSKATEGLLAISGHRVDVTEHYAMTGEWLDSDIEREGARTAGVAVDEADQVMRGQESRTDSAARGAGGRAAEYLRTTTGIVDGVIITLGNYRGFDGVSMLALRPAVIAQAEQPTIRVLCGRSAVPSGWSAPSVAEPTNLPDELLLSICKNRVVQ